MITSGCDTKVRSLCQKSITSKNKYLTHITRFPRHRQKLLTFLKTPLSASFVKGYNSQRLPTRFSFSCM
jgi:hypothetical protein